MSATLIRFLPYIAAVMALAGGVLWYGASRYNEGESKVRQEWSAAEQKAAAEALEKERGAAKVSQEVSSEHQARLVEQDKRYAAANLGPVRLCNAERDEVPAVPDSPGGHHGSAAGDGLPQPVAQDPPPDIGPELKELVRLADRQTQQLTACQAWIQRQSF